MKQYDILIIGGGTAGIMTAAQLRNQNKTISIAIIEPSKHHYYQAAFTLVGAGTYKIGDNRRDESKYIPKGVDWIQDKASAILPAENLVSTVEHGNIGYRFLVVAPGVAYDLDAMPGLREALESDSVCSNYLDPEKTWKVLQNFKGGTAIFTQPAGAIKCGGAPQKIMYLADEHFRKSGVRDKSRIIFATPGSVIFGVKEFAATLEEIVKKKQIEMRTFYTPVSIDAQKKEISFRYTGPESDISKLPLDAAVGEHLNESGLIVMKYEMLHLAPPQKAPAFLENSGMLATEGPAKGWLDVDINTLQHLRFPNVFGIGDVAGLPTAKTGAAVRKQAPVVVANLLHLLRSGKISGLQYDGYSSCPLVTGYGKMLLAEFKYNNVRSSDPLLSRFFDTTKELWPMWILKKYVLPWLYWHKMLRGKM